jgi:hypothetical protein
MYFQFLGIFGSIPGGQRDKQRKSRDCSSPAASRLIQGSSCPGRSIAKGLWSLCDCLTERRQRALRSLRDGIEVKGKGEGREKAHDIGDT